MQRGISTEVLVGRQQLSDELVAGFSGAQMSRTLILGQPGFGKTALAAAVVAALGERVDAVTVSATPTLSDVPFGALAPLLASLSAADIDAPTAVLRTMLARLRDSAAVKAGAAPLLVIDNAHALDASSAAVLAQISAADSAHLLILSRTRPGPPEAFLSLWRDGILSRHELPPLTDEEVYELCVQALGADVLRSASRIFARASGGNPLFLLALLTQGQRLNHLVKRNGVWILAGEPPSADLQLIDLIKSRIVGRGVDESAVLEAVCLAEPVPLAVLLGVGTPEAVDALEADNIITIAPDVLRLVRPAQPLYGEVVRQLVPLHRSMRIRQQVLQLMKSKSLSARGLIRNVSWALDSGVTVPDEWLLKSAFLANRAFDSGAALRASGAVRGPSFRDAASVQAARAHFVRGEPDKALRLLRGVLDGAQDYSTAAAAALLEAQIMLRGGAAADELHQVVNNWMAATQRIMSSRSGEVPAPEAALSRMGGELLALHACNLEGKFEGGEAALRRIIDHPDGNDETRLVAYSLLGELLGSTGRPESGMKASAEALRIVETSDQRFLPYYEYVVTRHILSLVNGGHWDQSHEMITEYLESAPGSLMYFGGIVNLTTGAILVRQGLMHSGLGQLRVAIEALRESDFEQLLPVALGFGAYAAAISGDQKLAGGYGEDFFTVPYRSSAHLWTLGAAHVAAARAAVSNLSTHVAELHRLATEAGEKGLTSVQQVIFELLIRTGDTSRLEEQIRLTACNEGTEALLLNAMSKALQAKDAAALIDVSSQAAAARYLLISAECAGRAAALYEGPAAKQAKHHAVRLLKERKALLEGISTFWLAPPSDSHGLTRREQDVAALVAEGLSNRQIAEVLSISHRTVEGHLYQMFTKLGITSRDELADL